MNDLAQQAVQEIEEMKRDKVLVKFVTEQALGKVAAELNAKINGSTTSKGVEILCLSKRNKNIADRVQQYIEFGFIGLLMAKYA